MELGEIIAGLFLLLVVVIFGVLMGLLFNEVYTSTFSYQCGQVFEEYTREYYYCIEYLEQDKHMGEIIDELKGE